MSKRQMIFIARLAAVAVAAFIMVGCGSNGGSSSAPFSTPTSGSVVTFGTDAPICDVESFTATITSASLVPQGGGQAVTLISNANPATVDFARLTDFTNILSTASVAPGTYSQFQMTLTSPQLTVLNTTTVPPTTQPVNPTTITAPNFTLNINPPLVVTSSTTSGLLFDFNLRKSVQIDGAGQVTGVVDPQIKVAAATTSGTTVGEADSLYGIVQNVTTTNPPAGFTGSFTLTLHDGTGQTLTILTDSNTDFDGDGMTSLANLTAGTFVEVDAIVTTSGQFVAQEVDSQEQVSSASQRAAFLGKVLSVTRDASGNATSLTMAVGDEVPDLNGVVPLHSALTVTLTSTTNYFTNWHRWNRAAFTFSPKTLGVAQRVAVHGVLGSGASPSLTAHQVFLRPRNVLGNFTSLLAAGSDGKTGGFTMVPCGALFQGKAITVLTYPVTNFTGVSGLPALTPAPTLNTFGLLFYEQSDGTANGGAAWTAPTWVLQARGVHQLPN